MGAQVVEKQYVKYVPKKQGRKWITDVTRPHGGLHKQEEFKKGVEMLEQCARNFRNPRLFHICFTAASVYIYLLAMTRLCRVLKAEGIDYRYKAALEYDDSKGEHFHVMIVLGANQQTGRFITADDETGKIECESALRKAVRHTWSECANLDYSVIRPKSQGGLPYIQFNQSNQEKFDNAVEWMSYIYKARSKLASGTVYFSDRQ
ncbi:hypothetical protein AU476_09205 [Cupriavidus sp. UYMSc13B]|nr:hypothetical protein AU476_09205 [Cupriavidus sp. UYMSc13B]